METGSPYKPKEKPELFQVKMVEARYDYDADFAIAYEECSPVFVSIDQARLWTKTRMECEKKTDDKEVLERDFLIYSLFVVHPDEDVPEDIGTIVEEIQGIEPLINRFGLNERVTFFLLKQELKAIEAKRKIRLRTDQQEFGDP